MNLRRLFFHEDDVILDPFGGSRTTLMQANKLGIHAIGIDFSSFNAMMTNVKVEKHKFPLIAEAIQRLTSKLEDFQQKKKNTIFEEALLTEVGEFSSE